MISQQQQSVITRINKPQDASDSGAVGAMTPWAGMPVENNWASLLAWSVMADSPNPEPRGQRSEGYLWGGEAPSKANLKEAPACWSVELPTERRGQIRRGYNWAGASWW